MKGALWDCPPSLSEVRSACSLRAEKKVQEGSRRLPILTPHLCLGLRCEGKVRTIKLNYVCSPNRPQWKFKQSSSNFQKESGQAQIESSHKSLNKIKIGSKRHLPGRGGSPVGTYREAPAGPREKADRSSQKPDRLRVG
jgi:hypothetical protein